MPHRRLTGPQVYETIQYRSLRDRLAVTHGSVDPERPTLYSIMRNERFFLEPFFDHYRTLGIGQFLILDDGSTDGSVEYLRSQPDCVLLASDLPFGREIRVVMPDRREVVERAGMVLKRVIGDTYCHGRYALYVDADEFLVLPPAVADIPALFSRLRAESIDAVVASLVEFYPRSASDLLGTAQPRSFGDLVDLYGWFDGVPLVKFRRGLPPARINCSASARLFARYGLERQPPPAAALARLLRAFRKPLPGKSATMKTPIVRWGDDVWMSGSHRSNVRPSGDVLLALAHFKFTHKLAQKTEEALRLRSYAGKSEKYELYSELMARMLQDDAEFACTESRHFTGPPDLAAAGLLEWGLDRRSTR